ncbi:Molybdate-binding periplasmic protein precursor [compost metagenome]
MRLIKNGYVLLSMLLLVVLVVGCNNANTSSTANTSTNQVQEVEKVELTVSAAASMTDALQEIQKAYEEIHSNVKINYNFGASGALQQQIEQGAPADLFLSAATKNMKALVDKQLIDSGEQLNLLKNELVVVVPSDSQVNVQSLKDLSSSDISKLAIGIPESVPAGNYAKEALTTESIWDSVDNKTVQGKDVRQVLQYVETGNADAGFVYKTDALTSSKVKIALTVDPSSYPAIEYPIGIVKATKYHDAAEDFYSYLQSQDAIDVFIKYGFTSAK